jgi:hypothetical protein
MSDAVFVSEEQCDGVEFAMPSGERFRVSTRWGIVAAIGPDSRELKRLGREAAERARIPVQCAELEDHEGQDVADLSGLMDPFVRVWR